MSNINNIPEKSIEAWCNDYAEICAKHGLYLVIEDDCWLQSAGEPIDYEEAYQNMIILLLSKL